MPTKVCKITESTKFGNTVSGVYSNQWLVGNLGARNIFRTDGACCHAIWHLRT